MSLTLLVRCLRPLLMCLFMSQLCSVTAFAIESSASNKTDTTLSIQRFLSNPKIKDAISALKNKRVRTVETETYTVTHYVQESYWECYRCGGCLFRRLCTRWRPVHEQKTRNVIREKGIGQHTILDDPTDTRVGDALITIDLQKIPTAAGARASRINTVMQRFIPDNNLTHIDPDDRLLTSETMEFSPQGAPKGFERKIRIVAKVDENNSDRVIELTVLVAERNATDQILETDKVALSRIAQDLAKRAAAELSN